MSSVIDVESSLGEDEDKVVCSLLLAMDSADFDLLLVLFKRVI